MDLRDVQVRQGRPTAYCKFCLKARVNLSLGLRLDLIVRLGQTMVIELGFT